ncbi:MAG: class I SAM-dependent methyltransferase [Anaerolineae bacterium]|nr:class I SAM-dependent methyltransferase [Anaerolineae bacterium]
MTQALAQWPTVADILAQVEGHLDEDEARLLYDQACGDVIEIGSFRGRSTCALAAGVKAHGGRVYAIDPHPDYVDGGGVGVFSHADAGHLLRNIVSMGLEDHVRIINLYSEQVAQVWRQPVDFVFVDGFHSEGAARHDVIQWGAHLKPGGRMAVHDRLMPQVARVIGEALADGWVEVAQVDNTVLMEKRA